MINTDTKKTHIAILGGGSAGWMTAAALSSQLNSNAYKITLIESPTIGTVSVGEATIPGILEFNQMLGIDERDFLSFTKGSFKLGIVFKDWLKKGQQYMHPFGPYGVNMQGIPFHHYWLKNQAKDHTTELSDLSIEYCAAKHDRFSHPNPQSRSPLANIKYAYHFDATLYAEFLNNLAVSKGVHHIQDTLLKVHKSDDETIHSLELASGKNVTADLFIDCSGFKGRLIEQELHVQYEDWRKYLPCDSAIAVPSKSLEDLKPYTIASAHENGWQWQIPLQHRVGNGFVYSSQFISEQKASEQLLQRLPSEALDEPRKLTWVNGKRKQVWKGNCIAIGLSAGFIEPLESTGLQLIQSSIMRLLSMFPRFPVSEKLRQSFNDYTNEEIDRIRDFVILHYVASERKDSDFWQYCNEIDIPEGLKHKIELYQASGNIYRDNNELFNEISWFSVLNGQGIKAKTYHPFVDNMPSENLAKNIKVIKGAMQEAVNTMSDHKAYLNAYLNQQ